MQNRRVYKYGPLKVCFGDNPYELATDVKGKPVHVGIQDNGMYIWCEVYGEEDKIDFVNPISKVVLYPTGSPYKGDCVGSFIDEACFVWHAVVLE